MALGGKVNIISVLNVQIVVVFLKLTNINIEQLIVSLKLIVSVQIVIIWFQNILNKNIHIECKRKN